jgi:hypothetical protein
MPYREYLFCTYINIVFLHLLKTNTYETIRFILIGSNIRIGR